MRSVLGIVCSMKCTGAGSGAGECEVEITKVKKNKKKLPSTAIFFLLLFSFFQFALTPLSQKNLIFVDFFFIY